MTSKERAVKLRMMDLLTIPTVELAAHCQALGQSGRGTREELIERLHKAIWKFEYDA